MENLIVAKSIPQIIMFGASGFCVFILFVLSYVECSLRIDPVVNTNVGLIRGLRADDGDYNMFLGIPYAQVDKDNPFGESTPQPKFEETFEAYDGSAICPQVYQLNGTILGTVNCLHLNIYVPTSATSDNPLPVMVWLYGGAFKVGYFGRNFYGPSYLVKHDVIVVTLNYRVGAYGFMCLDNHKVPGNQGLKDQLLAMRWVKDNIEAFGGDADKITLFGNSAGGHSVDLHLISEKEKLYNNVIIQSGSSLAATVLYEPDRLAPLKIAERLGLETTDIDEAISFLAKSESNLVVAAANNLNIIFKPCVEVKFNGVEPFLSSSWVNAKIPKAKNMPILLGFNEHEMTEFHLDKTDDYYKNLNIVGEYLSRVFNFADEEFKVMKNLVSQYYFGDDAISRDRQWDLINFDSDITYMHPVQRSIEKYLEARAGNIYYYMFSYVGGRNVVNIDNEPCCASHTDEFAYLFDLSFKPKPTEKDRVVIDQMTTMWTNLAKFGDPTPHTTELLPVKWVPLTKETYSYMKIGEELSLGSRPAHSRMAFWHLFYKLNENKQRMSDDRLSSELAKEIFLDSCIAETNKENIWV